VGEASYSMDIGADEKSNYHSDFLFALVNSGAERALKLEVESMKLPWRFSYQKKGFVAFKADPARGQFTFASLAAPVAFARRLCLSIGKADSRVDAEHLIADACALQPGHTLLVHHARYYDHAMRGIPAEAGRPATRPRLGQRIGTVVELGPQEFFAGLHLHNPAVSPDPAGDSGIAMPERSPSRAWLKLEEAIRFFDIRLTKNDIVVEAGCAPGGVALALLERGVSVIGVDPASMAEVIAPYTLENREDVPKGRPLFYHCRKPAALCGKKDLGHGVTWFMSDMNQSPEVILKECIRFAGMASTIKGALMTLKLTDLAQVVDKEGWFAMLRAAGFSTIRLQSLSVSHRELALLALR
jgi:23S rRNA (cytidine2498-2'-O)-methyltransferase